MENHKIIKLQLDLELRGKTATGFVIPEPTVTELGGGKKPQVKVTFKNHTYRTSIASMKGEFLLPVSAEIREITGVAAGDNIAIEIELDTQPREISVPDDLLEALKASKNAHLFFESLSYSNKRRIVEPIMAAKAAETRARRIEKTISLLEEGKIA